MAALFLRRRPVLFSHPASLCLPLHCSHDVSRRLSWSSQDILWNGFMILTQAWLLLSMLSVIRPPMMLTIAISFPLSTEKHFWKRDTIPRLVGGTQCKCHRLLMRQPFFIWSIMHTQTDIFPQTRPVYSDDNTSHQSVCYIWLITLWQGYVCQSQLDISLHKEDGY